MSDESDQLNNTPNLRESFERNSRCVEEALVECRTRRELRESRLSNALDEVMLSESSLEVYAVGSFVRN